MERYLVVDLRNAVEILSWVRDTKTVSFYTNAAGHTYWTRIKNDICPKVPKTNEKHGRVHSIHESIEAATELADRLNVEKQASAERAAQYKETRAREANLRRAAGDEFRAVKQQYIKDNYVITLLDTVVTQLEDNLLQLLVNVSVKTADGRSAYIIALLKQSRCFYGKDDPENISWSISAECLGESIRSSTSQSVESTLKADPPTMEAVYYLLENTFDYNLVKSNLSEESRLIIFGE